MVQTKQATPNGNAAKHMNGSTQKGIVIEDEATDIQRWRLLDERGRQTWHYLETDGEVKKWPQSVADRYFLGLPLVSIDAQFELCGQALTLLFQGLTRSAKGKDSIGLHT